MEIVAPSEDVYDCFRDRQLGHCDVIIVDECQFLEPEQVDQLRAIVDDYNLPVMCFGLRTDFNAIFCRQPPLDGSGRLHSGD